MVVWLSLGVAALVFATGCHRGLRSPDTSRQLPGTQATITGTVRGAEGAPPVAGRTLAIIDVATGRRTVVQTSSSGGFSVAVPAGRYRLEMSLRNGETLIKRPDLLDLDRGGTDANIELVVGRTPTSHPRSPSYRTDNGLGSPIA
jgi:hypothetical protein